MEQLNLGRIISEETIRELVIKGLPGDLTDHPLATDAHGATSAATPNRIMTRDESGRAKVAAPAADDDIARKLEVDQAAKTAEWGNVSGRPTAFPADTHNHAAAEITSGVLPAARGGTGNANGTAAALTTGRTIAISGGATGTATSFNGTANISIPVTGLDVSKATAGTLPVARGGTGNTTGNAATATKLATTRTIAISGGATGTATGFDGSGNIAIPVTALDVSKANAGTLPVARGGTGRTDNLAAGLVTARTIAISGGATGTATSFNGTANISIPVTALDVSKANAGTLPAARGGTGRTDGKVAALATARNITVNLASTAAGSFDGSANITPGVSGTLPLARGGTGATTAAAAATALGAVTAFAIKMSGSGSYVTGASSAKSGNTVTLTLTRGGSTNCSNCNDCDCSN